MEEESKVKRRERSGGKWKDETEKVMGRRKSRRMRTRRKRLAQNVER